jgi:hypothetical protein
VTTARDEHLGTLKGSGELDALLECEGFVEVGEVVVFLLGNVLGEVGQEGFDGSVEARAGGLEVL